MRATTIVASVATVHSPQCVRWDAVALVSAALGYLVLIGMPWAAASYWVSHRVIGVRDRVEQFALGFAGVGVATWVVWVSGQLLGLHPVALVAAPIIMSGILVLDAKRLPRSSRLFPEGRSDRS